MKYACLVVACAALAAPSAALFAEPAAPAVAAAAEPGHKPLKDPNRIICKEEDTTGSLIGKKKVCMTSAEWRERSFRAGQWAEHQQTYDSQPNGG